MHSGLYILIILPFIAGCSVFGINNVEEAGYNLVKAEDHFELREYAPLLVAETYVDGDFDTAGNQAFKKLFAYISGENIRSSKISMTAPVIVDRANFGKGETVSMTAPVLEERTDLGWRYMFVLPSDYNVENAPMPLNDEVKLVHEPEKRVAVIRFSGLLDEQVIDKKSEQLTQWILDKGLKPASDPRWAGYNPPWTIPFLRRNEVMIEVS